MRALSVVLAFLAACAATPKGEPPALLAEGKRLFEAGDYKNASRWLRRLETKHEETEEAEEALYLYAESQRRRNNSTNAFNAYQRFVTRYPNSRWSVAVAASEYQLGVDHLDGKIPSFLFFGTDARYGIRVLEHMQIHFQNHSLADDALMRLADFHLEEKDHEAAADALRRLLSQYPRSPFTLRARFQLARSFWLQSEGPDYDERTLLLARRQFQDFIDTATMQGMEEPLAEQIEASGKMILVVNERLAHKHYRIGRFYERTDHPDAAAYHYEYCRKTYPDTEYARRSGERLQELGTG